MKIKILLTILFGLFFISNLFAIEVNKATDLWALFCPEGHLIYFTEKEFKNSVVIFAKDFFVNNRGFFYKGVYYPIWWSRPEENQATICPVDKKMLRFETQYLKRIN